MAQSFLPFCAHCEKQIVVPNTSILFCSEKCKRKDQARSPSVPINMPPYNPYGITPPMTPLSHELDGLLPRNYVQPLSPTPPRSGSAPAFEDYPLVRSMSAMSINTYTPEPSRPNSGSASPIDLQPSSPSNSSNIYQPPRRPVQHMRTMTAGSLATMSSYSAAPHSGAHGAPVPTQYQYGGQQRPLPPLHRPHPFSTSPRSIDLVTPYVSTPVSPRAEPITTAYRRSIQDDDKGYDSRRASGGSLKTLFNFDAIRGEPYVPEVTATSPDRYLTYSNGTPILARMSPTSVHMR